MIFVHRLANIVAKIVSLTYQEGVIVEWTLGNSSTLIVNFLELRAH